VIKKVTKTTTKQLTILKRQATKDEKDLCKALRSMTNASIFELQSFRSSSKKSLRKSPQKPTIHILDAPHLSPLAASCIAPIISPISPSLLPSSSPSSSSISRSQRQRKASMRRTTKKTIEKFFGHEEMATPITSRVSRTRRVIKAPRR